MERKPEYFKAFDASLRIIGEDLPFAEIESILQLSATHKHRKGERIRKYKRKKFEDDRWILESPIADDKKLDEHLEWLWLNLGLHKEYLLELKNKYHIDVYAGYRSDCWHCGTVISASAMRICYEINIPLEFSIVVT